jgi:hypothetical protein
MNVLRTIIISNEIDGPRMLLNRSLFIIPYSFRNKTVLKNGSQLSSISDLRSITGLKIAGRM